MIIDCQLKSLLKNYLKTLIVGFGQADALGYSLSHNAYQQCLPSSSVQIYRINIAKALWLRLKPNTSACPNPTMRVSK